MTEKVKYYNTPYGMVYINVDAVHAGIKLSSGFDSALLLYMTALAASELNPELIIRPLTVRRANATNFSHWDRVDNVANVEKIIAWVRSCFPQLEIRDTLVYDAEHWYYCEPDEPIVGAQHTYVMAQNVLSAYIANDTLIEENEKFTYKSLMYNGVTKNPDFELSGFNPERKRNLKVESEVAIDNSVSVIRTYTRLGGMCDIEAFRNADKRISFWLADSLGILDTLLTVSRSCEGNRDATNNWTEECMECWWCYERQWAHETYKDSATTGEAPKYISEEYFKTLHYTRGNS